MNKKTDQFILNKFCLSAIQSRTGLFQKDCFIGFAPDNTTRLVLFPI